MTRWVMRELSVDAAEANRLRKVYWHEHGTTLAGLMTNHGIDPEAFMTDVHDIDFTVIAPDPDLRKRIDMLPGRKIIYTNGSAPYAGDVLEARGLENLFDAIYGVEHAGYRPKPERAAFDRVFAIEGLAPDAAAMFEDEPRNLEAPKALGLKTIHVAPAPAPADYIDHHTDDLSGFLAQFSP